MLSLRGLGSVPLDKTLGTSKGRNSVSGASVAIRTHQRYNRAALPPTRQAPTCQASQPLPKLKTPVWPVMYAYLKKEAKLQSLQPSEVARKLKQGWVLLDVRPAFDFLQSHAEGSVNVQLFRLIDAKSPQQWLKKLLYQSQGTTPVEVNPFFLDEVEELFAGKKGIRGFIVCCAEGGNMTPSENLKDGVSCRSLVAAYRLLSEGGYKNVAHLDGGLNAWFRDGRPGDGEAEWQFNSKTPSRTN